MKVGISFITFIIVIIQSSFVLAQVVEERDTSAYAQIYFATTDHNFGDVNQGEKVQEVFKFKNTGNAPLILQNVLTTCGCTVPEWPKEPVPPAGEGEIKVIFDSTSKIGRQNKVVTIRSNSRGGDYRLRISAMVLPSSN